MGSKICGPKVITSGLHLISFLNKLQVNVPGHEREITLGEMIDLKLIDHTKTIVKSR